jgi:hypothetical protein
MQRYKLRFLPLLISTLFVPAAMQVVQAEENKAMTLKLTSTAFNHEGEIPRIHTCQ